MNSKLLANGEIPEDIRAIIGEIYEESFNPIYPIAIKHFGTPQDAHDVVQSFFIKKICKGTIDEIQKFKNIGYIIRSFRNHCIDIHRIRRRNRDQEQEYTEHIISQQDHHIEEPFDIDITETFDKRLQKIRELIQANFRENYYIEVFEYMLKGLKNPIIAEKMNKPIATIATAKHRIIKLIRSAA